MATKTNNTDPADDWYAAQKLWHANRKITRKQEDAEEEEERKKQANYVLVELPAKKKKEEQEERDREALALEKAIKNSVPLPVEYKILKLTNKGEKADRTAAEAKLKEMLEDRTPVKPDEIIANPDAASHGLKDHGFYLLDMRNLYSNKLSLELPNVLSWGLEPFKLKYERHIKPSQIVFIRVIRFSDTWIRLGGGSSENVRTMMFNAYFPNGDPITCRIQVVEGGKQGYDSYAPTQCVFELPVGVLDYLKLYKPNPKYQINPHDEGPISPDDVSLLEGRQDEHKSKIVEQGGIKKLIEERFKKRGGYFGGGGKLRSAKQTSKRRSVKSKPRYYRRSVGSINHRRKKTTRRRR